jgi:hypothetical protein
MVSPADVACAYRFDDIIRGKQSVPSCLLSFDVRTRPNNQDQGTLSVPTSANSQYLQTALSKFRCPNDMGLCQAIDVAGLITIKLWRPCRNCSSVVLISGV